jgi:hypothetical protein
MASHCTLRIIALLFLATGPAPGFAQSVSASPPGAVQLLSPHSASDWAQDQRQQLITHRVKELAGNVAVDCGLVCGYQDPASRTDCALEAFAAKKPFYVRYEFVGFDFMDGEMIVGFIAQNARQVVEVVYRHDGFPWKREHLTTRPCPDPVTLFKTLYGRLNCFPTGSDDVADIFSSSWY